MSEYDVEVQLPNGQSVTFQWEAQSYHDAGDVENDIRDGIEVVATPRPVEYEVTLRLTAERVNFIIEVDPEEYADGDALTSAIEDGTIDWAEFVDPYSQDMVLDEVSASEIS
jgi:hypothetical protein